MVNIAYSIQRKFDLCIALVNEAKSAEKAKVASLEAEVSALPPPPPPPPPPPFSHFTISNVKRQFLVLFSIPFSFFIFSQCVVNSLISLCPRLHFTTNVTHLGEESFRGRLP